MEKNYNKNLYRDLINDDDFVKSVIEDKGLEYYLEKYPTDNPTVQAASSFVKNMSLAVREEPISREKKDGIWNSINDTLVETDPTKVRSLNNRWKWIGIAASFFIAVGIIWNMNSVNRGSESITILAQSIQTVELPDGSALSLNAGSSVEWTNFSTNENRTVNLKGEGFFEVKKGSKFTVKTDQGEVQVLGTSFNVYNRDNEFKVHCKSGEVRVITKSGTKYNLTPGSGFDSNRETGKRFYQVKEIDQIDAWRNGDFFFNQSSMDKVIAEFERQFDVEIVQNNDLDQIEGNFYFNNSNIDSALYQISWPIQANFEKIEDRKYVLRLNE